MNRFQTEHDMGGEKTSVKLDRFPYWGTLEEIDRYAKANRGTVTPIGSGKHFLVIGDLEGTLHAGQHLKEYCEVLYLPSPKRMTVIGIVDNVISFADGLQVVILVAEDKTVYGYEEDTLHKLATTIPEFFRIGMQNFGTEVFHCGSHIPPLVSADPTPSHYLPDRY
ncbi:ORF4 [Fowl aviadenovirus 4]|nr:ORF4 [Fowl aviadenovirus 4]